MPGARRKPRLLAPQGDETLPASAYGFKFEGLDLPDARVAPPGAAWPTVHVERREVARGRVLTGVGDERASLALRDGGQLLLNRRHRSATFLTPWAPEDALLAHPYLTSIAAIFAHWLGREQFHGGVAAAEGAAWALLGHNGAGKSTTLAALARAGQPILADDLLVVHRGTAFAGPRCLDLRVVAAERLGLGELGPASRFGRQRMKLAPAAAEAPLRGWILLTWGSTVELAPLPLAQRLSRLLEQRALGRPPRDPGAMLELARLPAWVLRRPMRWDVLPAVVDRLLALIEWQGR